MQTPDLTGFFMASAGAGAALVGLLFVAVSVNPGRNAGPSAPPERQAVAASAYTALINAFFVSLAALIQRETFSAAALIVSVVSFVATLRLIGDLFIPGLSRSSYARRTGFIAIGVLIYGLQFYYAFEAIRYPGDMSWAYSSVYLLLAIYATGLTRAWQLLGAKRRSVFFAWFSPLNDLEEPRAKPQANSTDAQREAGKTPRAKPPDARPT